jgi:hypothetical protein
MSLKVLSLSCYDDSDLQGIAFSKRRDAEITYRPGLRVIEADTYKPQHARRWGLSPLYQLPKFASHQSSQGIVLCCQILLKAHLSHPAADHGMSLPFWLAI